MSGKFFNKSLIFLPLLAIVLIFSGCPEKRTPPPVDRSEKPKEEKKVTEETKEKKQKEEVEAKKDATAFITSISGLRRKATTDRKIDKEDGKGKVSNWMITLFRGEEIQIIKKEDKWSKVKIVGGQEGYIQNSDFIESSEIKSATCNSSLKTFSRPDLMNVNAKRTLDAGTLLYIVNTRDTFSEVNFYGQRTMWVLSEKLNFEKKEVEYAKVLGKMRWLKKKNKTDELNALVDIIKTKFADSQIFIATAEEFDIEIKDKPEDSSKEQNAEGSADGESTKNSSDENKTDENTDEPKKEKTGDENKNEDEKTMKEPPKTGTDEGASKTESDSEKKTKIKPAIKLEGKATDEAPPKKFIQKPKIDKKIFLKPNDKNKSK